MKMKNFDKKIWEVAFPAALLLFLLAMGMRSLQDKNWVVELENRRTKPHLQWSVSQWMSGKYQKQFNEATAE